MNFIVLFMIRLEWQKLKVRLNGKKYFLHIDDFSIFFPFLVCFIVTILICECFYLLVPFIVFIFIFFNGNSIFEISIKMPLNTKTENYCFQITTNLAKYVYYWSWKPGVLTNQFPSPLKILALNKCSLSTMDSTNHNSWWDFDDSEANPPIFHLQWNLAPSFRVGVKQIYVWTLFGLYIRTTSK